MQLLKSTSCGTYVQHAALAHEEYDQNEFDQSEYDQNYEAHSAAARTTLFAQPFYAPR